MRKRLFDLFFSLFFLLLASPIFLLCALAVKCSSQGPIFYAHPRVGRHGKIFGCLKFRSMYVDADTKLQPLLAGNPALMEEWKTYFKLKEDPRVTPVGKWLRKTSIDEFPQIFNILIGQMSVVGPRPLTEQEINEYVKEKASKILSVRPGLTSLWITLGRNELSLKKRIALEEYYVDNQTFALDCKLILQTVRHVFFPKGAY
jgi:exopolysaccharide production protein ExoY